MDLPVSFMTPYGALYGAISSSLLPAHYQALVHRGWRRSGTFYYKPDVLNSCCPHHTIRLNAHAFKPNHDQRKVSNQWNKFVLGSDYLRKAARYFPQTRTAKRRRRNHFDLLTEIPRSEYKFLTSIADPSVKAIVEPAHKFTVDLEPDIFTEEKYLLFHNYQRNVHKEPQYEISRSGFERFLCSGFSQTTVSGPNGTSKMIGSYHQCYRLDGRLIAFGVLDLLPQAVSSVYLIYHSDYEEHKIGKLSALRELALAIEGGYTYYYMGYYIHSCTKMRYKAGYRPTEVLDLHTLEFAPLTEAVLAKMDKQRYVSPYLEAKLEELDLGAASELTAADVEGIAQLDQQTRKEISDYVHVQNIHSEEGRAQKVQREQAGSIFGAQMPGITPLDVFITQPNLLGEWPFKLGGGFHKHQDLKHWEDWDISEPTSMKGVAAELAALLGTELLKDVWIDYMI